MSNSSIWPIAKTLSGANTLARVNLVSKEMKGPFAFPKSPELLEPHHQIV